jgi:hypothetical protein
MEMIGEKIAPSCPAYSIEEAAIAAKKIGYPGNILTIAHSNTYFCLL